MTDDSEDWFEQAVGDDESDDSTPADGSSGDETVSDDRSAADADRWRTDESVAADSPADSDADWSMDDHGPPTEEPERSTASPDSDDNDGSLFDQDFGSALETAADPSIGPQSDAPTGGGTADLGFDSTDDTDFDADAESDLSRLELGIEGLDGMIQGGVPERALMVAIGSAGTGKTTFGLQFLAHGLEQGDDAVFIALEESRKRVVTSATEKGYPFDEYIDDDKLAIVDLDPVEMATSLGSIQTELPALIEEFGASRLVLDSVSLLEMMYDEQATRRNEVYDFTKSVKDAGVTALLTSEASQETAYASRHGIIEYLTDAVFVLQYVRPDDFRETRLAVEIQKIRDANHSREKKPYEITDEGISVHQQANLF
ncbi:KaiC domain-containing protein [Salinadaptatus halalkaliphilus]|uniref:KaiC domain-containing protein n=1 Tax=Salinadaptatus halalkaliphilus TaxID=2419781 RepID=A0A4S3TPA2_9EURY|nr:KaiC domain-containing protein [Salinadaptatus halalkaliphilus]THE66142.1 KaiC domain-containing protein [Salinadaptatus halalkaliphilus]